MEWLSESDYNHNLDELDRKNGTHFGKEGKSGLFDPRILSKPETIPFERI